ncbi:hypothetical protein D3C81_1780370 [compost metagenome]
MQGLGYFACVFILLDQQLLVAFQGFDLFPVDRDCATVLGLQQQFAAIEEHDLTTQAIPVLHPHGIGNGASGRNGSENTQQDSEQHKQTQDSGLKKIGHYPDGRFPGKD